MFLVFLDFTVVGFSVSKKSIPWTYLSRFFLILIVGGGVLAGSTRLVGHWLAYCTCPGWLWWWRNWWNEDWQGKPKYSEKTYPSATLSSTNPTWPDPGSNPGRRGGKPATNRFSYGAALKLYLAVLKCELFIKVIFELRVNSDPCESCINP
jgi:hypothetical protein